MSKDYPARCLSGKRLPNDANFDTAVELEFGYAKEAKSYTRRVGVYHPSSLHSRACLLALYHDRIGTKPKRSSSARDRNLFKLGHAVHDMVQKALKEHFPDFEDEIAIEYEPLHIYGHTDGVFHEKDWGLEIKSIGATSYKALVRPKPDHVWQIHCYMAALDIPRFQLLYVNRNTGEMRLFRVFFDETIWTRIKAMIQAVETHVEEGTTPEGVDKSYVCRGCKFAYVCEPSCLSK